MKPKFKVAVLAILVIAGLEAFALYQGVDGTMFAAATSALGGIIGFMLRGKLD